MVQIKVLIMCFTIILLSSCNFGTVKWYESFRFTGTVEKKLNNEGMLDIKEYDAPEGRKQGLSYEIPVDNMADYQVGDRLLVIVETNTDKDIWDLNHLRFDIKAIEN
ncbi:hypothetical protein [Rossellomorea sp. NPDC077527]|uniref:hypothetical protein n=1 Tax=Rossellomorea sp. NPDC077527 TaxID=3364510 RepID=UPI0037C77429